MPSTLALPSPDRLERGTPLRVLDVTDFYSDTVSGGVKTYLHAKAEYLAAHGVEHVMVVPGPVTATETLGATRIHRIRGSSLAVSRAYRVMFSVSRLRDVLDRERPDVVEVGSPFIVPHLLRAATRGRPIPTVGFYHADIVRTFAEPYVPNRLAAPVRVIARMAARRLVRHIYRRFDATVAASRSVVRELESLGVPHVRTVGLGVDLETFRPRSAERAERRRAWGVDADVPVGIYAGRFCAEKRLDVLLNGHGLIPEADRPHLVLVGGGPWLDRLREVAAARPRLTLRPYVHGRDELAGAYNAADFYLAPGPGETFGLAIAEAMACGLPVVVVDRAAAPDRVRGSGVGELYAHGDAPSAAAALRRMTARVAANGADGTGPGTELRRRARAHAEEHFDWARTFRTLVDLYRELAAVRTA